MSRAWLLPGATRDAQTVTPTWEYTGRELIAGVAIKEVRNIPRAAGFLTEVLRMDWNLGAPVDQVFQVTLAAGAVSAWHAHEHATDRLFANRGLVRIVLYDPREESPTRGKLNEFFAGTVRPQLIVVPPRVWHGVQNMQGEESCLLNLVDRAYRYADPDHYRLPADTPEIPFRFPR